jgi:hypothetical protein
MKKPKKNSRMIDDHSDPLAGELDFTKLERIKLGPGWAQLPRHLRGPKHLREARAWLKRKNASTESFKTMLASEAVLRRDWDRPEEDAAWADL